MRFLLPVAFVLLLAGCAGDNTKTDSQIQKAGTENIAATFRSKQPSNYTRTDGRQYNIKVVLKKGAHLDTPLIVESPKAEEPAAPAPALAPAQAQATEEEKILTQNSKENIKNKESAETESGLYYVMKYGSYAGFLICFVACILALRNLTKTGMAVDEIGGTIAKKLENVNVGTAEWQQLVDLKNEAEYWAKNIPRGLFR